MKYHLFKKLVIFIAILLNMSDVYAGSCAGYPDVDSTHQYCEDITFATVSRWVNGYKDGTFKADKKINREEFTKIVVLASRGLPDIYKKGYNCFNKAGIWEIEKSNWASGYICFAKNENIISGYPDGLFKPYRNVNYVEALKITLRAFGYKPNENTFPNWFDPYIEEAQRMGVSPPLGFPGEANYTFEISRGYMAYLIHKIYQKHTLRTLSDPQNWDLVCDAKQFTFDSAVGTTTCEMKWALQILYETQLRAYSARASIIRKKIEGTADAHDAVKETLDAASAFASLAPTNAGFITTFAPNVGAVVSGSISNPFISNTFKTAFSALAANIDASASAFAAKVNPLTLVQLGLDGASIYNDFYGAVQINNAAREMNNVNIAIAYLTDFYALGGSNERLALKYAGLSGDPPMPVTIYNYALRKGYKNTFWSTNFDVSKIVASVEQTKVMNSALVTGCYINGKCYGQKAKESYTEDPSKLMR